MSVLGLNRPHRPFRCAHGVADEHTEKDCPGRIPNTVMFIVTWLARDVGEYATRYKDETDGEFTKGLSHGGEADTEEYGENVCPSRISLKI